MLWVGETKGYQRKRKLSKHQGEFCSCLLTADCLILDVHRLQPSTQSNWSQSSLGFSRSSLFDSFNCFVLLRRSEKDAQAKSALSAYSSAQVGAASTLLIPGGHTAEMITLLSTLDLERYTPRVYVYCTGDSMSVTNVVALESATSPPVTSQKVR
jgi:hypothetical protein